MSESTSKNKFIWPFHKEYDPETAYNLIHPVAERDLQDWEENSKHNGEVYKQLTIGEDGKFITKDSSPIDAGPRPPMPIKVLSVTKVTYHGFEDKTVTVKVLCDDNIERICTYNCEYYPATWVDQEELEEKLTWENIA